MGYIIAQAAVTKYYTMDGLNNRNFFLIALEAEIDLLFIFLIKLVQSNSLYPKVLLTE